MRRTALIALAVAAVIAVPALVVVTVGYLLPVGHVATVTASIPAPPQEVWATLTDPAGYPAWRREVTSVEMLPAVAGRMAWREASEDGAISYVMERIEAPRRLVTRITDDGLPFGGSWEYLVSAEGTGSRVQITELGEVYNPVFRFVSRFVTGHSATASAYLTWLGRRYGVEVAPDVVVAGK